MRIGYLHISPQQKHESGIARYSRYLAAGVAQCPQVETKAIALVLRDDQPFMADLKQVLEQFKDCDVLHLQYSKYLGLTGWKKLCLLKAIQRQFKGRLCVTLHDIYSELYRFELVHAWAYHNKRLRGFSNNKSLALRSTATYLWHNHLADKAIMQWLLQQADCLIVCNQAEADRLQHFDRAERLQVIPHFVEARPNVVPMSEAKHKLGWSSHEAATEKVVTLQGFIYRSKGHALLLDAISLLPENIRVVFAGGMAPNQEAMERELKEQVQRLNLGHRLTITGYLSEEELELYLAASDLAVCPFQIVSASGSLSTWISMGRPILAYDLPQVQELNQLVPGAIATFSEYTPESLAAAILTCLEQTGQQGASPSTAAQTLREKLSLQTIAEAHEQLYRAGSNQP